MNDIIMRLLRCPIHKMKKQLHPHPPHINYEKTQWLPREELFKLRYGLFRKLINEAYNNVPFWHNAMRGQNLKPGDFRSIEDITKLVITNKEMMRGKNEFVSEKIKKIGGVKSNTGGSTGRQFEYWLTNASIEAGYNCSKRSWKWAGHREGDRIACIHGGGLGSPEYSLDCVGMNENIMDGHIKKIQEWDIHLYRGIPTGLYTFAKHVEKRGVNLRKKCTLTTSETLLHNQREFIGEILGEVFDGYGANDGGSSAYECSEHNGWHIAAAYCYIELTKGGERVSPGEEGIITVTNFHNYGMPWIRYLTNDIATYTDEACPCGRGLPLLSKIKGRTADLIRTPNCIFNGTELINNLLLNDLPLIAIQIVQKKKDKLIIRIQKEATWGEEHEKNIINVIQNYDSSLFIEFEYLDEIPKTPAGKSNYVISELT